MSEAQDPGPFARIESLIGSGAFDAAVSEASALCVVNPSSTEALRLRALSECLLGNHAVAAELVSRATSLPDGDTPRLSRLAAFIEDQRHAVARASAYNTFCADNIIADRWNAGRSHNLEIYMQEPLAKQRLTAIADAGHQLQLYALSPIKARILAEQLVLASDEVMSIALNEAPPVLFLSDSHSRYFEWLAFEGLLPQRAVGVCTVSEANLYGLYMPSRDVPTRRRFREALDRFPPHSAIVLHLGEVDCRALYWNLRERLGPFGRGFYEAVTGNFERLLDEIAATHPRIVVAAPVRPTYPARPEDLLVDGELILKLTNALSVHMETVCAARGLGFVSISRDMEEFGASLQNPYFRTVWGKRKPTHHLCAPKVAGLWSRALAPHLRA